MIKYTDMDHEAYINGLCLKASGKIGDCCEAYVTSDEARGCTSVTCSKCGNEIYIGR